MPPTEGGTQGQEEIPDEEDNRLSPVQGRQEARVITELPDVY